MARRSDIRILTDYLRLFVAGVGEDLSRITATAGFKGADERAHQRYFIPDTQTLKVIGLVVCRPVVARVDPRTTPHSCRKVARLAIDSEPCMLADQALQFAGRRPYYYRQTSDVTMS